ncbi:hypothetical protein AHF37_05073 [Paragonimus kellicotti]|nr:hypothetical protein AHF37_05073 [Paragonimus kellicotti]
MPPHSNDPYLVPSSVKRLRGEMGRMVILKPAKTTPASETDPLPSGTSSAISSQVFADSVEDEHEVLDMIDVQLNSNHLGQSSTTDDGALLRPRSMLDQGAAGGHQWSEAAVIDYAMYDETRSLGNTLATSEEKPMVIPKGELLSTQALKTTLSSSVLTIPFAQECSAERQKLALPPTPDSLESLFEHLFASSDEETDGA